MLNVVNEALRQQHKKRRMLRNVENQSIPAEDNNQQLYEELNFDQI